jgi:hypothetical protein
VTTPSYTVLLELPGGRLVAAGLWPEPSEAHTWASSLVSAEAPVRLLAVVPVVATAEDVLAAVTLAVVR